MTGSGIIPFLRHRLCPRSPTAGAHATMSTENCSTPDSPTQCPACGAAITPETLLCIACGYHMTLGHHLATVVERQQRSKPDENPYASPAAVESSRPPLPRERPVFDLTEAGVRRASAVVSDARSVFLVIVLAWCVCAPAWLVMLPWYAYRLYCWHRLNAQFAELRSPNAFSPHGELATKFKDARTRLWIGVIAGLAFWTLLAMVLGLEFLGISTTAFK